MACSATTRGKATGAEPEARERPRGAHLVWPAGATIRGMDPNTLGAVVAAVGAIAAAAAAFAALPFTIRAANAARDQTRLQRELAQAAAQPYVWADVQPDHKQGTLLQVVVGNAGPTVATDVRVTFDPPLPVAEQFPGGVVAAQRRLDEGIRSLAPGRIIEWSAGRAFDVLKTDEARVHTITVTANGPYGPVTPLTFEVNLSDWRESRDAPAGTLHLVREAIQSLTREVAKINSRGASGTDGGRTLDTSLADDANRPVL